jgi:hypothetical protein
LAHRKLSQRCLPRAGSSQAIAHSRHARHIGGHWIIGRVHNLFLHRCLRQGLRMDGRANESCGCPRHHRVKRPRAIAACLELVTGGRESFKLTGATVGISRIFNACRCPPQAYAYPFVNAQLTTILNIKIVSDFPPQFAIILKLGQIFRGSRDDTDDGPNGSPRRRIVAGAGRVAFRH